MSTILQQRPAPGQTGTPEAEVTLAAREWREKDREHIAEKSAITGAAEYRARRKLRINSRTYGVARCNLTKSSLR